jgi:hypothetical protein
VITDTGGEQAGGLSGQIVYSSTASGLLVDARMCVASNGGMARIDKKFRLQFGSSSEDMQHWVDGF